jgi:hypothetical protein
MNHKVQQWFSQSTNCYGSVAHISCAALIRFLRGNTVFKLVNTWVSWHPTPPTSMLHFIPQIAWHVSPIRITLQFVAARSISSYTSLMNYKEPNFTLSSQLGLVLHVRTLKLKRKGEFQNTHKAKGHQLCNGQQSAHTLCLCHSRKVSHYTVRIPMTSGPILHVRTPNWKEKQNWNTHKPKGHQKCNGQQSALNPWLPDLELQQPLASYWGIEYRSSSSTNQSKQEYFWTNSEWSTEYRRAFNIDM